MKRDYSGWVGGVAIIFGLLVIYAWSSYTDLTKRQSAYLYHPKSGDIYSVSLAPIVSKYRKWAPFIPFTQLSYSEPDGAEYLGRFQEILENERLDRQLMKQDFDAWKEKADREFNESMKNALAPESTIEYWDIEYSVRNLENPIERLRDPMQQIVSSHGVREGEVLAVDAVVIRNERKLDDSEKDSRPSFSVLRDAFLLKGTPAALLYEEGVL